MAARSPDAVSIVYPSPEWYECPYPAFSAVRGEPGVYKVPGREDYLVTRHEDIVYVLRHPELFSTDWSRVREWTRATSGGVKAMIVSDPPEHKPKRELCFAPFTPKRLRDHEALIQGICDDLVDAFVDRGRVEILSEFAHPLATLVTCELLGIPRSRFDDVSRWATIQGNGARYLTDEEQAAEREEADQMMSYLGELLQERYEEPRHDVVSELIRLQIERDGAFDRPYLAAESSVLLLGGIITTAHMIASATVLLLHNPAELQRVQADHSLIRPMIEEALRLEAPIQWTLRVATRDTEIAGTSIPEGAALIVALASGGRDERRFEDPDRFDIGRANVTDHLSFGRGTHFCFGAPLARLEGRLAFATLLERLRNIRFADGAADPPHVGMSAFRAPEEVHVEFDPA